MRGTHDEQALARLEQEQALARLEQEQALARLEQVQVTKPQDAQTLAQFMEEHNLVMLQVQLLVSRDTLELWNAMAQRLELGSWDGAVQALALIGAATVAQMDLGLLPKDTVPIDPDKLRSIVWPWLRKRFGAHDAQG